MDVSLEAQTKPLYTLSTFSYIPPRRKEPKEMSFFNRDVKAPEVSMYDLVFHQAEGYDMTLHRDDRKHHKGRGLDINEENTATVLFPPLYLPGRQHARVACIKAEFFRKNGIMWNVAEGYGSVVPI
ncbi:protein C5orf49-like protein [Nibea albiflora]|uniref:Protein C5orf49-like protein n=1 Tax=Nibea albiflora TaxID=240163 RepID=A0ACB7ET98_NIBAL|nr:protein C5orf49-like protein [Nibea albiflora]